MMTIQKFAEYLSAEPFRPFRIKMVSGQTFDIRHPEMVLVGHRSVRVYLQAEGNGYHWQDVSMTLMETLEPITTETTGTT